MSNPYPAPTLEILNSIETPNMSSGVVNFRMLMPVEPNSIIADGNIFQYEFWVYDESDELVPLIGGTDNSRFIPIENTYSSQQDGIVNQVIFGVPIVLERDYNDPNTRIKVRAYAASLTSPTILYTEWSNALRFVNPPPQPVITTAYLLGSDETYTNVDELYIQLYNDPKYADVDLGSGALKFLVSYYYLDENSMPRWIVSDLVTGTRDTILNQINLDAVQFPSGEDAKYPANQDVSVAVNAVYNYVVSSVDYHAISQISATVTAVVADYEPPSGLTATYDVYSNPSVQQVVLEWLAPNDEFIPNYNVNSYKVYVSTDGGVTFEVVATVPNTPTPTTTYTYTGISDGECGDSYEFYVTAVFSAGQESEPSNEVTINYFEYPTAPQNVNVVWCNQGYNTSVDIAVTWQNPATIGCCKTGSSRRFKIEVLNDLGTVVDTTYENYHETPSNYAKFLNDINTTSTGSVRISLLTYDTNSPYEELSGPTDFANYTVNELPFVYDVVVNDIANTLSFKVLSSTILAYIGQILFNNSGALASQEFYTNPALSYSNETVSLDTTTYPGEYLYTFTFQGDFFTNNDSTVPNPLIISPANNYGVAAKIHV